LCIRSTAMPLFAWPLTGSISDVSTLENTLQFLDKLGYKPNCLMLDRAFPSKDNISYMLRRGYVFLQALKVNAKWVCDIIDAGEADRLRPDSMLTTKDRTYYVSTTYLQCVRCRKQNGKKEEEYFFYQAKSKRDRYRPQGTEAFEVIEQYPCQAHVLFCQDLVGNSWDRFMGNLNSEYTRLINDPSAKVGSEYAPYFVISKPKYARKRTVDFCIDAILKHKNKYAGYVCFLTNDPTISTAEYALKEYSTRDYIEKDFDEMKNDLDMKRIRVHTDDRMRSRLFINLSFIYISVMLVHISKSDNLQNDTQNFSHIKAISKDHFLQLP
jgi:transposase